MPISLARAQKHTTDWAAKLGTRSRWPKHLFYATHITTAVKIIETGRLLSRKKVGNIAHDVANRDAIGTNPNAWKYVRLYFRPRTDFHLRTEGIKLLSDSKRLPAHMSIPVMFVLNFANVVTRPNVCFCERKMAHANISPGHDEKYFNTIDFNKVYHEQPILDPQQKKDIHDRRMAEVLIPDELPLTDATLDAIVCRTQLDAASLQHLSRGKPKGLLDKIRVAIRPDELFFCWGAYIEELQYAGNALTFRVKAARDYTAGKALKFRIVQERGGCLHMTYSADLPVTVKPFQISGFDPNVNESWLIELEDALAFSGVPPAVQKNVFRNP